MNRFAITNAGMFTVDLTYRATGHVLLPRPLTPQLTLLGG